MQIYADYTIINASNPFGMVMPGRSWDAASALGYRYGFNGKESDHEIKGECNNLDFGARIYDPRLGKFLAIDQYSKLFSDLSPYNFSGNSPIIIIDQNGLVLTFAFKNKKTKDTDIQNLQQVLNTGLGGYATATIDPNTGVTTLSKVKDFDGSTPSEVVAFYNNLNNVIIDPGETKIKVYHAVKNVVVGNFDEEAIDIVDIMAFQTIKNTSGEIDVASSQSKLIHEVVEQFGKQIHDLDFNEAHDDFGIPAEEQTIGNGIKRGKDGPQTEGGSFVSRPTIYTVNGKEVLLTITQDDTTGTTTVSQSEYKKDKWDSKEE